MGSTICIDLIMRTEHVQRRASKCILDLPFVCNISYNQCLSTLNLLPLCYWHEFLDIVFLFKSHHYIINLSSDILPHTQYSSQFTRSANHSGLQFQILSCKTAAYQKSFPIRATRVLTIDGLTLKEFRKYIYIYIYINEIVLVCEIQKSAQ